ncbi:MAG: SRPBCC family protein [Acidobacteriia bacterium]|nr:SRPBCC family protein [Terriglobia bacterium]
MAVKIEKTFRVDQPTDKVWAFLSDPRKVGACVPGAEITEQVDERTYKGAIKVKVGPSVTDYKGEVQIVRLDQALHEIEILGKGQDVRGKGSASMKMTGKVHALDSGSEVTSISELNVVGILAQMGSRVISEVSNVMFEQFLNNFRKQLQSPDAAIGETSTATAKPISAVGVAFSALKATFTRHSSSEEAKADLAKSDSAPPVPDKPKDDSGGK